jgi:hypothetical protein
MMLARATHGSVTVDMSVERYVSHSNSTYECGREADHGAPRNTGVKIPSYGLYMTFQEMAVCIPAYVSLATPYMAKRSTSCDRAFATVVTGLVDDKGPGWEDVGWEDVGAATKDTVPPTTGDRSTISWGGDAPATDVNLHSVWTAIAVPTGKRGEHP